MLAIPHMLTRPRWLPRLTNLMSTPGGAGVLSPGGGKIISADGDADACECCGCPSQVVVAFDSGIINCGCVNNIHLYTTPNHERTVAADFNSELVSPADICVFRKVITNDSQMTWEEYDSGGCNSLNCSTSGGETTIEAQLFKEDLSVYRVYLFHRVRGSDRCLYTSASTVAQFFFDSTGHSVGDYPLGATVPNGLTVCGGFNYGYNGNAVVTAA